MPEATGSCAQHLPSIAEISAMTPDSPCDVLEGSDWHVRRLTPAGWIVHNRVGDSWGGSLLARSPERVLFYLRQIVRKTGPFREERRP